MWKYLAVLLLAPVAAAASTAYSPTVLPIKYDFDPEIMLQITYPNQDGVAYTRAGEEQCFSSKLAESIPCEDVMIEQIMPEPEEKATPVSYGDTGKQFKKDNTHEWYPSVPDFPNWICCYPSEPIIPVDPELPPVGIGASGWFMLTVLMVLGGFAYYRS